MHPGFSMYEHASALVLPELGNLFSSSVSRALLPGRWPHLYHTAPLAPLSPNLIVTVGVLSSWHSAATCPAFMSSLLYSKALLAPAIKSVCQCYPYWLCFISFSKKIFFNSKQRHSLLRCVWGDLSLSKGPRDHTEAFLMHPVSAPSPLCTRGEEAGNNGNFIPVPQEPQNHT